MVEEVAARVQREILASFCRQVFSRLGVAEQDAIITADVLVTADLRGVASHGVAHLRRYVEGLKAGTIVASPRECQVAETLATATVDAGAGLGPPVSHRAMQKAIQKAQEVGVGFCAVRNSNHFGIAGYYAMLALDHDCIGFALTNASPMLVPTFARNATLGTNPIAIAVPAGQQPPFMLDMATSTVALGKLEIAEQLNRAIPSGWAIDSRGLPILDPARGISEFRQRMGGGLLPLGGEGEERSGYKGYGLALWVEIFSGVLSGAAVATLTYPRTSEGRPLSANLGHFFGAWRIECFRPVEEFYKGMEELLSILRNGPKAEGESRIYIPGEKEQEAAERNLREGIPLNWKVVGELAAIARELELELEF